MKKNIMLVLFILTGLYSHAQTAPPSYDTVIQRLGKTFETDTSTAALSIGILHKDNMWFYNFGKEAPGQHAIYEIGSITKTFTSLVLAHAVTEGKISFNDDIRKYLEGDLSNLAYQGAPIRLVNLANTTSGLPDNFAGEPDSGFTRAAFFNVLATVKPDTLPGTRARHSNMAARLLSYILETVYREPIDVLIKRYILGPLQMTETSFGDPFTPPQMLTGHNAAGNRVPYLTGASFKGTGSMRSTTGDMIKYLSHLADRNTPETKLALTPTVTIDAATNKVTAPAPIGMVNDRRYALSLNWFQYHPGQGDLRIWTDGGTSGFRSYIVMYPEAGLSLIFLSNRTGEKMLGKMYDMGDKIFRMVG